MQRKEAFPFTFSPSDRTTLSRFSNFLTSLQNDNPNDPELSQQRMIEYATRGSEALNTNVFGRSTKDVVKDFRDNAINRKFEYTQPWNNDSGPHYDAFAKGPAVAYTQLLDEVAGFTGKPGVKDTVQKSMAEMAKSQYLGGGKVDSFAGVADLPKDEQRLLVGKPLLSFLQQKDPVAAESVTELASSATPMLQQYGDGYNRGITGALGADAMQKNVAIGGLGLASLLAGLAGYRKFNKARRQRPADGIAPVVHTALAPTVGEKHHFINSPLGKGLMLGGLGALGGAGISKGLMYESNTPAALLGGMMGAGLGTYGYFNQKAKNEILQPTPKMASDNILELMEQVSPDKAREVSSQIADTIEKQKHVEAFPSYHPFNLLEPKIREEGIRTFRDTANYGTGDEAAAKLRELARDRVISDNVPNLANKNPDLFAAIRQHLLAARSDAKTPAPELHQQQPVDKSHAITPLIAAAGVSAVPLSLLLKKRIQGK